MIEDKLKILTEILGYPKRQGRGEFYFTCPYCHHHNKKFAVNFEKWGHIAGTVINDTKISIEL
jgi:hypothetical protein